ncbi:endospore germination permease [Cohnella faecalis]|nr:endospore germination permease [Cohnella faecalis]
MMQKRYTVSSWQMAALFLAYITGSAIVWIPAPLTGAAKNAAWISLWLAFGLGTLVLACILYLHRRYPDLTFVEYSELTLGRIATTIIAIPFLGMLLLMLSNITIGISQFFNSTMMRETPSYVFHLLILFTAAITVRAGIEVMARMFMLLLIALFIFVFSVLLLNLSSYRPELLTPVFEQGFKQTFFGIYQTWGFPYGEIILFSTVLPFIRRDRQHLGKLMFSALLINAISLSLSILCTIMALGPMAATVKFSLFELARLVEVADIIERIESVIGMTLIAASYMKATIVLFIFNATLSRLLRLQDEKILIFPTAFLTFLLTMTMYRNELEFNENVTAEWPLIITFFGVVPNLIIILVTVLNDWRAKIHKG